jgi:hypothetical protein
MADLGGAPKGNQNAAKGKRWADAIERALERRTISRSDGIAELDACADALIDCVLAKDLSAIKELGDRLDGKPKQQVEVANGENGAFIIQWQQS